MHLFTKVKTIRYIKKLVTHNNAMLTMWTSSGKTAVARVRAAGKMGPNTRPITLVKNALAALELTNQMSNSMTRPIAVRRTRSMRLKWKQQ
jgi:hypothetical protein